jgi:hypothetical protein
MVDKILVDVGFLNAATNDVAHADEAEDEDAVFLPDTDRIASTTKGSDSWHAGWRYTLGAVSVKKARCTVNQSQVSLHNTGYFALAFALLSSRILYYPLWTISPYIPVLCPIYDEGLNWQVSPYFEAILCHVFMGMIALTLCVFQFNAALRQRFPAMHRWNGRLYVITGVVCVGALQPLQAVVGQGSFNSPSVYMQAMVFASSALWLGFTAMGVLAARKRKFQEHKQWMLRSAGVLSVPMTQRFLNFWYCPACMILHIIFYGWHWQAPPGPEGALAVPAAEAAAMEEAEAGGASTRAKMGELTLSLEGWGRAELEVFGLSAWTGLLVNLAAVEYGIHRQAQQREQEKG